MENFFKINEETLNNVLGYLATKPFNEVAGLIQLVQNNAVKIDNNIKEASEIEKNI